MIAALALAILLGPSVLAAPAATQMAAVTPESIESAIQEIEAREGLDEELKTKLLKLYRRIRSRLDDTRAHEAAAEAFHKAIAATPKEIGQRQAPAVRQLAEGNAALSRERSDLLEEIKYSDEARAAIEAKTKTVRQELTAARRSSRSRD